MAGKSRPCFIGDGVARFETKFSSDGESAMQFGQVLRAPKKHGRVFNANSEVTEKDISWSTNLVPITSASSSNDVFLLERPIQRGSLVKYKSRVGEVIEVESRATVKSIDDEWIISNIPFQDLSELPEISGALNRGMAVMLDNHVGRIESVCQQISFRLPEGPTGYFTVLQDEKSVLMSLDDKIQLTEEQLKTTVWDTEGAIAPTDVDLCSSPATIFRIETVAVEASWEAQIPSEDNSQTKPPTMIEGQSVNKLKILRNTPSRLRECFYSQLGPKLVLTVTDGQHIEKLCTWAMNMMSKVLLDFISPSFFQQDYGASQQPTNLKQGDKMVVNPLFLQSQLTVRWNGGGESTIDSTLVDEIVADAGATFVTRSNTDYKDASYGIVYNCSPEQISTSQESVNVLWFVDLKNDRLDAAVRVLRLQQEQLSVKDLIVLNDMQKLLNPREILMRRDKSDEFKAGKPCCITQEGRIEVIDFDGHVHARWPTLLTPCMTNVRTSVATYDNQKPDDSNFGSGVDWTEIYYDAMADFDEVEVI